MSASEQDVTVFEEPEEERQSLLDRILGRGPKIPRKLTTTEMGGPEPHSLPLVAGRFAGPSHLTLEGWLNKFGGAAGDPMPGHDPGAVEEWRRRNSPGTFPGVVERAHL